MKLTDEQLFQLIWECQLRKVASDVLVQYSGGNVGVIDNSDHSYEFCSQQARVHAGGITDQLSPSTIKRRIKGLVDKGWVKPEHKNDLSHTMIDGNEAKRAFEIARQWWINQGIPTGGYTTEDGRQGSKTVRKPSNLESMIQECGDFLVSNYPCPKVS